MSSLTEQMVERIYNELSDYGVSDFVVIVRDPDSEFDLLKGKGSDFWRMGAAKALGIEAEDSFRGTKSYGE